MDKIKVSATVEWAFLNQVSEMSNKYQVDLCNLSQAAVAALKGMGIEARYRDDKADKGYYITCKSSKPIKAYDEFGTLLGSNVALGNGSKAHAIISFYDWKFNNKAGRSPTVLKLVITDLKEYASSEGDVVDVDNGLNDSLDGVL